MVRIAAISAYLFSSRPVFVAFFLYAFALGTIFPRLGDLQLEIGLSESELGLSLIGLPIGVEPPLLAANRIVNYFTLAQIMIFGSSIITISYTAAALFNTPTLFFLTLLIAGLSVGPLEVAVNLEADRVEYGLERRIINRSHAFWSLGFCDWFEWGTHGPAWRSSGVPFC